MMQLVESAWNFTCISFSALWVTTLSMCFLWKTKQMKNPKIATKQKTDCCSHQYHFSKILLRTVVARLGFWALQCCKSLLYCYKKYTNFLKLVSLKWWFWVWLFFIVRCCCFLFLKSRWSSLEESWWLEASIGFHNVERAFVLCFHGLVLLCYVLVVSHF